MALRVSGSFANAHLFSPFVPTQWREALHEIACAGYEGVEFAIVNPNDLDRMALMGVLKKKGYCWLLQLGKL